MATIDEIKVVVTGEDKASGVLAKIGTASGKLGSALVSMGKLAAIGIAAAGAAITAFAISSIREFIDSEQKAVIANQALENSLRGLSKTQLQSINGNSDLVGALKELKEEMQAAGAAALKLGFDDDQARVSFAKLFQATKDVGQANKDLALAMDIARFKSIGLEEATSLVTRMHAGATKVLKEFGIEVEGNITDLEALALIEERVTGTAIKMSDTTGVKLAILSESFNNLKENVGAALAVAINPFITALSNWASNPDTQEKFKAMGEALGKFLEGLRKIPEGIKNIIDAITEWWAIFSTQNPFMLMLLEHLRIAWDTIWKSIKENLIPAWNEAFALLKPHLPMITELVKALGIVFGVMLLGALIVVVRTIGDLVAIFAGLLSIGVKVTAWLADQFIKNIQKTIDFIVDLTEKINKAIDALRRFSSESVGDKAKSIGKTIGNALLPGVPFKAAGGPVFGGSPYIVGEQGPELFIPRSNGQILPNGAGLGGMVINITGTFLSQDAAERMAELVFDRLKLNMRI